MQINTSAGQLTRADLLKGVPDKDPRRKILDRLEGDSVDSMLACADDYLSPGYMSNFGLASVAVSTVAVAGMSTNFLSQMMDSGLTPALNSVMSMPGMLSLLAVGGLVLGGMLYERHSQNQTREAADTTVQLANQVNGWNLSGP